MDFTLVYRGSLHANGDVAERQRIRRDVHKQLRVLWTQVPLGESRKCLENTPGNGDISVIQYVGGFRIAPLVTSRLSLVAELDITVLRPEAPGGIVTAGGDIDNRVKTLLDALRMPKRPSELPSRDVPTVDENPLFCLLEDDCLVTALRVRTDRLLLGEVAKSHVELLMRVHVKPLKMTWANMGV